MLYRRPLKKVGSSLNFKLSCGCCAVTPTAILDSLYKAIALYQQNTVLTLGQNTVYNGSAVCNNNDTAAITSNTLSACKAPKLLPTAYQTKFP
jgi:hypothetical protein